MWLNSLRVRSPADDVLPIVGGPTFWKASSGKGGEAVLDTVDDHCHLAARLGDDFTRHSQLECCCAVTRRCGSDEMVGRLGRAAKGSRQPAPRDPGRGMGRNRLGVGLGNWGCVPSRRHHNSGAVVYDLLSPGANKRGVSGRIPGV
jgi:hypothetical protein